jgi:hypothetical protein
LNLIALWGIFYYLVQDEEVPACRFLLSYTVGVCTVCGARLGSMDFEYARFPAHGGNDKYRRGFARKVCGLGIGGIF